MAGGKGVRSRTTAAASLRISSCAESGLVLTSTVAPAVLMSEIELQRQRKGLARPPILGKP